MGIIKDRHGTFYVQRKVPERLQEAVARVLNAGERRVYLKKSLGTKSLKEAKAAAPHVLADFNRIVGQAEALLKEQPVVTALNDAQINRMAEHVYATTLKEDEALRFSGRLETVGPHGENVNGDALWDHIRDFSQQFAAGDVSFAEGHAQNALASFGIAVDQSSMAYRSLCIECAKAFLKALDDIGLRYAGAVVETPRLDDPKALGGHIEGGTLRDALEGWKKVRSRPEDTVHEYARAIEMFIQLHGNLAVANIKRSHARAFREALQLVPKSRKGTLLKAGLPELSQWGLEHANAPKVSAGTVNKQLGACQAIALWGYRNGIVPDDVPWADPFKDMRLQEDRPTRAPFDASGLQAIFNAPLFTEQEIPEGGKGPAAVWLPLLALFAGGRQSEFAGLRASDIREDPDTKVPLLWIVPDKKTSRRVKTETAERVVPVHSQLIALGFLDFAASRRHENEKAWLFPDLAPDRGRGAMKAWSKWWSYYLRNHIGIKDRDMVFHSFRHGFTDRARVAKVEAEVRKALMGHADPSVSGEYGAKNMLMRWGGTVLQEAVEKITYPGLDLSRIKPPGVLVGTRGKTSAK